MKNSKLIKNLKNLSIYQLRQFKDYVFSPFFNKNEQIKALLNLLLPHYPNFEDKYIRQSRCIQELGLTSNQQLYTLNSKLLELLTDFLTYIQSQGYSLRTKTYTIQVLRQQGEPKALHTAIRQHQILQEHYPYKDAKIHFEKHLFYDQLDQLFLENPRRTYDENLQLKSDHLDIYYLITKLKIACDMASRNIVIKANYSCGLLDAIQQIVENQPLFLRTHPGIDIYYQILKMLKKGLAKDYQLLKKRLEQHIMDFPKEEMLQMYDYAQNYCIRQINTGDSSYYKEFMNLYKTQLQHNILFRNNYLEEWDYKNISTAGIRIQDYEWTEWFIHQMKHRLKPQLQENAFAYNLAALYYATQRYKEALQLLQTIEFTDTSYHLGAKIIQLKSYYELNEFDAFLSLIQSFRIYVQRNKQLSEYRRKANLNMLKLAKKIAKLQEQKNFISNKKKEQEVLKIESLFKSLSPLANADWLQSIWTILRTKC